MKSPFNDGGKAFPRPMTFRPSDQVCVDSGDLGMCMREWYAATVPIDEASIADITTAQLSEFLGEPCPPDVVQPIAVWLDRWVRALAKARFMLADAMIAESEKKGGA